MLGTSLAPPGWGREFATGNVALSWRWESILWWYMCQIIFPLSLIGLWYSCLSMRAFPDISLVLGGDERVVLQFSHVPLLKLLPLSRWALFWPWRLEARTYPVQWKSCHYFWMTRLIYAVYFFEAGRAPMLNLSWGLGLVDKQRFWVFQILDIRVSRTTESLWIPFLRKGLLRIRDYILHTTTLSENTHIWTIWSVRRTRIWIVALN